MGGLLFNDKSIKIRVGGLYTGAAPTFTGTSAEIMLYCREARFRDGVQTTNTKGAGTFGNQNRYHSQQGTIDLTVLVPNTGTPLFVPVVGQRSPVRRWIEVTEVDLGSLTPGDPYIGVITEYDEGGSMDEVQTQRITLDLNADVIPA